MSVTADDLRAATWQFAGHLNMGSRGGQTSYRCAAFPEAAVIRGHEKVRGALKGFHVMQVCDERGEWTEFEIKHLDLAAAAIAKVRQARVDEAEWEAAAPQRAGR